MRVYLAIHFARTGSRNDRYISERRCYAASKKEWESGSHALTELQMRECVPISHPHSSWCWFASWYRNAHPLVYCSSYLAFLQFRYYVDLIMLNYVHWAQNLAPRLPVHEMDSLDQRSHNVWLLPSCSRHWFQIANQRQRIVKGRWNPLMATMQLWLKERPGMSLSPLCRPSICSIPVSMYQTPSYSPFLFLKLLTYPDIKQRWPTYTIPHTFP